MATVAHLFRAPKRRLPMQELESAEAVVSRGFSVRPRSQKWCAPASASRSGNAGCDEPSARHHPRKHHHARLNVNGLTLGEQLRIGSVLLQVSAVCTPCDQLEK